MSQFADIFKAVKGEQPKASTTSSKRKTKEQNRASKSQPTKIKVQSKIATNENKLTLPETTRRTGKSSNPEYTQVLTYIRKNTHKEVRKVLLDDETGKDFSDLVESMLSEWLSRQADR